MNYILKEEGRACKDLIDLDRSELKFKNKVNHISTTTTKFSVKTSNTFYIEERTVDYTKQTKIIDSITIESSVQLSLSTHLGSGINTKIFINCIHLQIPV